jgi:hypothetical protein
MSIVSNQCFWDELPREIRKLIPHLDSIERKSYVMLLRVMQAVMYARDSIVHNRQEPTTGQENRIHYFPWNNAIQYITWTNTISGVDFEVERISGCRVGATAAHRPNIDNECFLVTTEDWEATLRFFDDPRAANEHHYGDCPYFMRRGIMLESIEIAGDVDMLHNHMMLAALSIASLESAEVFYKGTPF